MMDKMEPLKNVVSFETKKGLEMKRDVKRDLEGPRKALTMALHGEGELKKPSPEEEAALRGDIAALDEFESAMMKNPISIERAMQVDERIANIRATLSRYLSDAQLGETLKIDII